MSEQSEKYVKVVKKHLDRIVIGLLYLLLFALAGVWYMEQGAGDVVADSGAPAKIPDEIKGNPFWKSVQTMAEPQKIESYPGIQQIRQYNMFDYKAVRQKEDLIKALNQKFTQAQEAEKAGRQADAVRLLKEIIQQKPTYRPARDLLDKLEPTSGDAKAPKAPGA